jgi:predicted small secreted protein
MSVKRAVSLAALIAVLAGSTVLGACSTTAGAGQDLSSTGHAITNSADKVKSGL